MTEDEIKTIENAINYLDEALSGMPNKRTSVADILSEVEFATYKIDDAKITLEKLLLL